MHDGDALETFALEETAICQAVVVHSMDWALALFNEGVKNRFTDWTNRLEGSRYCWGWGRSRGGPESFDLAFALIGICAPDSGSGT